MTFPQEQLANSYTTVVIKLELAIYNSSNNLH